MPQCTLKKRSEFVRITKAGESVHFASFVLQFLIQKKALTPDNPYRFGLTASKKVGNAVRRNRCKRRLRAVIDLHKTMIENNFLLPTDIVLVAKKGTFDLPFSTLEKDFINGITHIGKQHEKNHLFA